MLWVQLCLLGLLHLVGLPLGHVDAGGGLLALLLVGLLLGYSLHAEGDAVVGGHPIYLHYFVPSLYPWHFPLNY